MMSTEVPQPSPRPRDAGFTLTEMLIVMVLTGVIMAALSAALSVTLRVTPMSEDRIDDARSTRLLSTWLANDTTSTPPFIPEQPIGGFNIDPVNDGTNNLCNGLGDNVIQMRWTETITSSTEYVANYRFVVDGDAARIHRYTCASEMGDPFTFLAAHSLTPSLDPSQVPSTTVTTGPNGKVTVVSFTLVGISGENVLIETTSRNPSDFFL